MTEKQRGRLLWPLLVALALAGGALIGARYLAPEPPVVYRAPPGFKTNREVIHARTLDDIHRLREQAIRAVFGPEGLPTDAALLDGVTFTPAPEPGRKLAIFHAGHSQDHRNSRTPLILLAAGYDVLAVNMPAGHHGAFEASPYPLRPFLLPTALGLNYAMERHAYDEVVMTGLSGGGWTTVVYSALDTRIRYSVPVAGSVPEYLRTVIPQSEGDFEQTLPGLEAGYLDLYLMAASEGRRQLQVFNRFDPCCFSSSVTLDYRPELETRARDLGGTFGLVVDEFGRHELSPTMAWLVWGVTSTSPY